MGVLRMTEDDIFLKKTYQDFFVNHVTLNAI